MLLNKIKAHELMRESELDTLVLAYTENVMYFSDFLKVSSNHLKSRLHYIVFFADERLEPSYLVPHQDIEDASRHSWIGDLRPTAEYPMEGRPEVIFDKEQAVADIIRQRSPAGGAVGFENESLPVEVFERLRSYLPAVTFKEASKLVKRLRAVKSAEELARISRAMDITQEGARAILGRAQAGISERELAVAAKEACLEAGADAVDFVIVGAAANGAIVHGSPTDYRLEDGDIVRFDLGAAYQGYPGDFARTFVVGSSASEAQQRHYRAVYEAVQAGIAAVRPGATAGEVYEAQMRAGRAIDPGLVREHAGHGVGLEVHEEPMIYAGSDFVLEEGMIVMIENGRYLNGQAGYQLEDLVLVTATGNKMLTSVPRTLVRG